MDPRTVIVNRIDLQLRRHLGQGVDAERALSDSRYTRDMLLVCDAMSATDLPVLARQYRKAERLHKRTAQLSASGRDSSPPAAWRASTSGFGSTRAPALGGGDTDAGPSSWFSPSRWLNR